MEERGVLLVGRSLLFSGVAAGLAECPDLRVAQAATWDAARGLLAERMPDVLIFDLANGCASQVLLLLLENPGLRLLGLDTESNQALLISGQGTRSLTLSQIREIAGGR